MEQKITTHIVKGFIISLILIVISIVGHLANLALESWYGWIGIVIFFGGVVWSVNLYGKQMNNNVTFGNLFAHGFKVSAVIVSITFVFTLLSVYVIFPETIDQIVQKAIDEARKQNNGAVDQIQQNLDMVKKVTTISLLAGSVIGGLVIGALASLIGAATTKKNPNYPFDKQPQM